MNRYSLLLLLSLAFIYTGCEPDEEVCNDENPCTTDSNVNGECVFTPVVCNDSDVCTADSCAGGTCIYTPINCEDTATFILDIKALHGADAFVLGQTYENAQDYQFSIDLLRFYLSHLVLVKDDGTPVEVKDVEFLNFEENHSANNPQGERVTGTVPAGNYTAMRFAIGVDSTLNFGDPATYASSHPLSIYNGSHWSWNSGYIFMKLEGNIDTIPNGPGTLHQGFLYHTGTMPLYREVQFDDDFAITANTAFEYNLKLDVNRFFYSNTDTLDVVNENFTHTLGSFAIAEKVANLFSEAFSKR